MPGAAPIAGVQLGFAGQRSVRAILALIFGFLTAAGAERAVSKAPSSIEPEPKTALVRLRHVYLAVTTCTMVRQMSEGHCLATYEERDATTALTLRPIRARRLRGAADRRTPVNVAIGSEGTPGDGDVIVAPGTWEIDWPGYPAKSAFVALAGKTSHVRLGTTFGACERGPQACRLREIVSRTVGVVGP
jgi:hypothetical protein